MDALLFYGCGQLFNISNMLYCFTQFSECSGVSMRENLATRIS